MNSSLVDMRGVCRWVFERRCATKLEPCGSQNSFGPRLPTDDNCRADFVVLRTPCHVSDPSHEEASDSSV